MLSRWMPHRNEAEDAAAQALIEAEPKLNDAPGTFKVSLVLADDRMGGWTNRTFSGFGIRFPAKISCQAAVHYRAMLDERC